MTAITQDYPLSGLRNINFKPQEVGKSNGAFGDALNAAKEIFNETNVIQKNADLYQRDLASGRTDNILAVLLAQDKAYSSLNFTVQVTNRLIESYREIMRMQL
jgi:flagellar hook-basal body complex protein FliE